MDDRQIELLKRIVQTPSPTGFEVGVANVVRGELAGVADEVSTDTMGSVHATYQGYLHHGGDGFFDDELVDDCDDADYDFEGDDFEGDGAADVDAVEADFDDVDDDMDERIAECEADLQFGSHTLMFAAHMDEIGLMVTYISPEGFLSVSAVGGVDAAILPGMRVDVHAKGGSLRGVVGRKPIHLIQPDERKSVTALDKLVIDLGMSAEHVKEQVSVGDPITFAVGFERFGDDMAVSRAFDDKAGVFVGCRVMEELAADEGYTGTFVAALTVQEEIGTRGAMTSAHSVKPDVAIAFDVTHATDYPGIDKSEHGEIICGEGPVIARGPNINPVVFERLVAAAEAEGIKYQIEAEPSVTGTDARAIQVTRGGIPTGLISIPLRYMHTPTEVIDLGDLEGAVRLVTRFARDLDDAFDFIPGHPEDTFSDERMLEGGLGRIEELMDEVERLRCELADLQAVSAASFGGCAGCASAASMLDGLGDADWESGEFCDGFEPYEDDFDDFEDGLEEIPVSFSTPSPAIKIELEVADPEEPDEPEGLEELEASGELEVPGEFAGDGAEDASEAATCESEGRSEDAGVYECSEAGMAEEEWEPVVTEELDEPEEPEGLEEPEEPEESQGPDELFMVADEESYDEGELAAEGSYADAIEPYDGSFASGSYGDAPYEADGSGYDADDRSDADYADEGFDAHGEPYEESRAMQGDLCAGGFADVEIVDAQASDLDSDSETEPDTIIYDGLSAGSADMPTMSIPIITVSSSDDAEGF